MVDKQPSIAIRKKELYKKAVLVALDEVISTGNKITIGAVVDRAKYDNGDSVGETTIYAKDSARNYIHQDIRTAIANARSKQNEATRNGKKKKTLNPQAALDENKTLKKKVQGLTNQLIKYQFYIKEIEAKIEGGNNERNELEEELYIVTSVTNELTQGVIRDFRKFTEDFTEKYASEPDKIEQVSQSVLRYLSHIRSSKLLHLRVRDNNHKSD